MAELSAHEVQRRVEAAEAAIAEAWLVPEGLALASRAIAQLAPGYSAMIHFREPDGAFSEVGLDAHGKLAMAWEGFPIRDTLQRLKACIAYRFDVPDQSTGKVVSASQIFEDEARRAAYMALLDANGFADQLRVLLRRQGKMRVWCGVLRPNDRPPSPSLPRSLRRLIPAVRDAARAADLTRYGRADQGTVQVLFESIEQPIWLVTKLGTIAYANQAARRVDRSVGAAVRRAAARGDDPRFSISRVSIEGDALALVVGRAPLAVHPVLPHSLARVADGVARGWTDKQISTVLGLPIVTVRTYVRRCYARLGVHNRVELARVWRTPTDPRSR